LPFDELSVWRESGEIVLTHKFIKAPAENYLVLTVWVSLLVELPVNTELSLSELLRYEMTTEQKQDLKQACDLGIRLLGLS